MSDTPEPRVTVEARGHVLLMGLNRPRKRNAFDVEMIRALSDAYGRLQADPELRCGVVFGHGEAFCAGLDLMSVGPVMAGGDPDALLPPEALNPWGVLGPQIEKPIVTAAHGICFTAGLELMLAGDVGVAAEGTRIGQMEVSRGILALGGATARWPAHVGWGDSMRYLLTGDELDATEAHRIGLVQEVVPAGTHLERAIEIAGRIAAQAPLAVQATLRNARQAAAEGPRAAYDRLIPEIQALMQTADAAEGVASLAEKRAARFEGR